MCAYLRGVGRMRAIVDIDGRDYISGDGRENGKEDKELHG